jgi:hypothetical protein
MPLKPVIAPVVVALTALTVVTTALSAPAVLSAGCSSLGQTAAAAKPSQPRITILFDALCSETHLIKDWGYAALIEIDGRRILFDTGNNGQTLAHNARALGADLSRLDMVVMSHRHGDHMGGMAHLLSVNPKVVIYAPKEGFGVYGGDLPGSFYRRSESLPPHRRYYDGKAPIELKHLLLKVNNVHNLLSVQSLQANHSLLLFHPTLNLVQRNKVVLVLLLLLTILVQNVGMLVELQRHH